MGRVSGKTSRTLSRWVPSTVGSGHPPEESLHRGRREWVVHTEGAPVRPEPLDWASRDDIHDPYRRGTGTTTDGTSRPSFQGDFGGTSVDTKVGASRLSLKRTILRHRRRLCSRWTVWLALRRRGT